MRTPRSTRSSTPSDVSAGRGGTPGRVRDFTRGAPRVRPGSARGVPLGGTSEYVGGDPGTFQGCSRARLPGSSSGPGSSRFPHDARDPETYDRAGPRPRTTVRGRAAYGRVGPAGPRPGRPPTGTDRTRFGPRTTRPGLGPNWTDQGGTGRGRTGRAASRTTESPPRRAPRVRPRGPAPMHDLRGLGPRTTAGVRPRARPCGVRAAYDREGRPRWATCSGRAACDPREARTAHHRAGLGPCTTVRGSNCARPCGARTVHHRPGLGLCTTVRGSDCAPPSGVRGVCVPGGFRPDTTAPGLGPCTTAKVRPVWDREGPPPRRPCGAGPRTTVRGAGRVRPGRVSPVFDRVGPAPRTTPCGASTTYDLRDR
ncbi:hypothetical protein SAMN05442782_7267 [Streptomyces sp. OK228]|nr:hypothetical protein SAMN05442782_7267 [Streptomyces sp. OK228]